MSRMIMKRVASSAMNFLIQATKIGTVTFLTLNYVGGFVVCYGPSMEPTLRTHDVLLTEHISPRLKRIDIGDVVVARSPDDNRCVCKRVVAGPGDFVLYKNETIAVPEECVWLEGDNKGNSNDSRFYGPVPYSMVRRRCVCKLWPKLDLTLGIGEGENLFLHSTLNKQQHYHQHHEEEKQQQQSSMEKQPSDSVKTSESSKNSGVSSDKANDEREELFLMMKTSDSLTSDTLVSSTIPVLTDAGDNNRNGSDDSYNTLYNTHVKDISSSSVGEKL